MLFITIRIKVNQENVSSFLHSRCLAKLMSVDAGECFCADLVKHNVFSFNGILHTSRDIAMPKALKFYGTPIFLLPQ